MLWLVGWLVGQVGQIGQVGAIGIGVLICSLSRGRNWVYHFT